MLLFHPFTRQTTPACTWSYRTPASARSLASLLLSSNQPLFQETTRPVRHPRSFLGHILSLTHNHSAAFSLNCRRLPLHGGNNHGCLSPIFYFVSALFFTLHSALYTLYLLCPLPISRTLSLSSVFYSVLGTSLKTFPQFPGDL
jgi:hypothetical protein